jgi:ketosteroid isomerase-like protein
VLAITTALSATAQQEEKVEQGIRTLDAREAEAMLASNLVILDQLWSPAFVVNAPDNTVKSKEQVLNAVREARISYSAFDRTVERVVPSGDDLAISMGGEVVVPKGARPDAGTQVIRRYSHVWKRTHGDWLLIARHANVVPAPPR